MLLIHLLPPSCAAIKCPASTHVAAFSCLLILSLGIPNSSSFQQWLHLRYVSAFQDVQSEPKRSL
jgi:hypothetical protein